MTKHSDSPELSRVSGEQAEERTAGEIRIDREAIRKLAQRVVDAHDANEGMRLSQAIDDLDAAFPPDDLLALLSECSRLASRVEELEKALKLCMDVIWSEFHAGPEDAMNGDNEADIAFRAGQKALAGAHAEEKEPHD